MQRDNLYINKYFVAMIFKNLAEWIFNYESSNESTNCVDSSKLLNFKNVLFSTIIICE